jgi:hypothetical protein
VRRSNRQASYFGAVVDAGLFRVLDARDPVAGARVSAGGKSGTTNARGFVTLALRGRGRAVGAVATKSGYTAAHRRLQVLAK